MQKLYILKNDAKLSNDKFGYKIGSSYDVSKRVKQLQSDSYDKLVLINEYPYVNCNSLEFYIHGCLKKNNRHGEWFELTSEELDIAQQAIVEFISINDNPDDNTDSSEEIEHVKTKETIENLIAENQKLEKQIIEKDREFEKQITEKKHRIELLEMQTRLLTDYKNDIKVVRESKIGSTSYITAKFTPPPVQTYKLDEYSNVMKTLNIIDTSPKFMTQIVRNFDKKSLGVFLGNILVKLYKKLNVKNQSVFNTDVSRLSYIIREKDATDKISWVRDKNGVLVCKYIIQPYLEYIDGVLDSAIVKLNALNTKLSPKKNTESFADKITTNNNTIESYTNIKQDIESKILEREINKHMASLFYFNHNDMDN